MRKKTKTIRFKAHRFLTNADRVPELGSQDRYIYLGDSLDEGNGGLVLEIKLVPSPGPFTDAEAIKWSQSSAIRGLGVLGGRLAVNLGWACDHHGVTLEPGQRVVLAGGVWGRYDPDHYPQTYSGIRGRWEGPTPKPDGRRVAMVLKFSTESKEMGVHYLYFSPEEDRDRRWKKGDLFPVIISKQKVRWPEPFYKTKLTGE